ncbi:DUF433 domain-containing protein [Tumidithrix elongata RA019]|uniref:DUF433 domain-containing protein n=1 Tax=Tumidithrix elongata BACA0141 TaxID=2716417 RepID=A0AAW9PUC1_9CYAN|nr:DUF433 domain-containing protein [Tumidithrix elongata RA019]
MLVTSKEYIEVIADVRGGKPCISGTRIAVEDVALMHLKMNYSLAEIAGKYDLKIASVYAAIAYYFDHREEIDRRSQEEELLVIGLQQSYPSQLKERLKVLRGD